MQKMLTNKYVLLVIAIIAGILLYFGGTKIVAQQKAIAEAKNYAPKGICTMVITPAVHKATGAKYTFSSGCIPEGWEREKNK